MGTSFGHTWHISGKRFITQFHIYGSPFESLKIKQLSYECEAVILEFYFLRVEWSSKECLRADADANWNIVASKGL